MYFNIHTFWKFTFRKPCLCLLTVPLLSNVFSFSDPIEMAYHHFLSSCVTKPEPSTFSRPPKPLPVVKCIVHCNQSFSRKGLFALAPGSYQMK
uniref:Putative secreted protein n=1 Tax=Rhipicephalus microplus TaxID=6941 RepID=A0A6G5A2R3_RHIMP